MIPDLAALLADPERVAEVPMAEVPVLLEALAVQRAKLEIIATILAARLAVHGEDRAELPRSEMGPLTQDEAAERYRIPLRKLRFLTRTRRVPSYRLGRNRMVRSADLDRYLARCREQGAAVGTLLDVDTLPDVVSRP